MSLSIPIKEMFVVVIEYGPRRKPQVFGPFFDYGTATHWAGSQNDSVECKRLKYRRPHGNPNEFRSMTILPIKSYHVEG